MPGIASMACTFVLENISVPIRESSFFVFVSEIILLVLISQLCLGMFILNEGMIKRLPSRLLKNICWLVLGKPFFYVLSWLLRAMEFLAPTDERRSKHAMVRGMAEALRSG